MCLHVPSPQVLDDVSMTGREFMDLPDARRRAFLEGDGGRCFSRAEPRHKLEIVRLLKDMGEVRVLVLFAVCTWEPMWCLVTAALWPHVPVS